MSNFRRSLDLPLINCKIELDLSWSKNFIISLILNDNEAPANPNTNTPTQHLPQGFRTGATFQVNGVKRYVPAVILSINDNIRFLENIKKGFKRAISCNKYGSEVTTQPKNNNLDYMIDPTFSNNDR